MRTGAGATTGAFARSAATAASTGVGRVTAGAGGAAIVGVIAGIAFGTTVTVAGDALRATCATPPRSSIGAGRWLRRPRAASASRQRSRHASLRVAGRRAGSACTVTGGIGVVEGIDAGADGCVSLRVDARSSATPTCAPDATIGGLATPLLVELSGVVLSARGSYSCNGVADATLTGADASRTAGGGSVGRTRAAATEPAPRALAMATGDFCGDAERAGFDAFAMVADRRVVSLRGAGVVERGRRGGATDGEALDAGCVIATASAAAGPAATVVVDAALIDSA